jgi:hypothetical protein
MRTLVRFWSVVVMTAVFVGKGVLIVVDDSVPAIGVFFDSRLR